MSTNQRGKFIVLEGIDGSGKTSQLNVLNKRLREAGRGTYATFEPTDSPVGSLIHQIMTGRIQADNAVVATLFAADRLDHLTNGVNGIIGKIEQGLHVLCCRYYFSSYAYQGLKTPVEWIMQANSIAKGMLKPDMTIFIDISPETAISRIQKDGDHIEIYEKLETQRKVRQGYLDAFRLFGSDENICIIDGNRGFDEVSDLIYSKVSEIL